MTVLPFGLCAVPENGLEISQENEIFCSAAGPVVNLILSILLLALPLPAQNVLIRYTLYTNLSLFVINVLPILPLDGGRILYYAAARKHSPPTCEEICRKSGTVLLCILLLPTCYSLLWEKNPSLSMIWGYLALYQWTKKGSI